MTPTLRLLPFPGVVIYPSVFVLHSPSLQFYRRPFLLFLCSFIPSDISIMSLQFPPSPFTRPCTHPSIHPSRQPHLTHLLHLVLFIPLAASCFHITQSQESMDFFFRSFILSNNAKNWPVLANSNSRYQLLFVSCSPLSLHPAPRLLHPSVRAIRAHFVLSKR